MAKTVAGSTSIATQPAPVRVNVCLSKTEYLAIATAAYAAGLTPAGFVAEAVIAAARGEQRSSVDGRREAKLELMHARAQLRRCGNNLNQAARIVNAGGDPPEWLRNAVTLTDRVVENIDRAVQDLINAPRQA